MAKALSKSQLIAAVADKAQLSKKQAGEILDHIAADQLAAAHDIERAAAEAPHRAAQHLAERLLAAAGSLARRSGGSA